MIVILAIAALIPAIILMVNVYRRDKVEREPIGLVATTFVLGIVSIVVALVVETFADDIFVGWCGGAEGTLYWFLDCFIGVALVEELCKLIAVRLRAWNSKHFNYIFDGVVYCVAASLGFAAMENLLYVVFDGSLSLAVWRGLLSIPGHCVFGIFMGIYMGYAKWYKGLGDRKGELRMIAMAIIVPVLMHGFYDFALSVDSGVMMCVFFVFVVVVDIMAFLKLRETQSCDQLIPGMKRNPDAPDDEVDVEA